MTAHIPTHQENSLVKELITMRKFTKQFHADEVITLVYFTQAIGGIVENISPVDETPSMFTFTAQFPIAPITANDTNQAKNPKQPQ